MDRKKVVILIAVVVLVIAVAVGWYLSAGKTPALSKSMKAKIQEAHITNMGGEEYYPDGYLKLVWFDENGGKRDYHVVRYFGTYGDCIVLLEYGNGKSATGQPIGLPTTLAGLTRPVKYPVDCDIILYNTNPNYTSWEYLLAPYTSLYAVQNHKGAWLTDAQLEQLTCDLEAWVAAGNY